jgi:hypothetical protein
MIKTTSLALLLAVFAMAFVSGCKGSGASTDNESKAVAGKTGTPTADQPQGDAGAAADETKLVGKFKASVEMPEVKKDDPNAAMANMAKAMAESMTLELKADKQFMMTMIFPMEGKWTVAGDTLTLTMEKVMGMSMADAQKMAGKDAKTGKAKPMDNKPLVFKVSDGGDTLTQVPDENAKGKDKALVFKKVKA